MFPVRIFKKLFSQKRRLRWRPKRRITQPDVGRQGRVRCQKILNPRGICRQAQLGEKLRKIVHMITHNHLSQHVNRQSAHCQSKAMPTKDAPPKRHDAPLHTGTPRDNPASLAARTARP